MRLSDRLAKQLRDLIDEQGLKPGDRLPAERQLAVELGASRPSIREAIRQLSSQGLLRSRQGGGTYVQALEPAAGDWPERHLVRPLDELVSDDPEYRYDVLEARHALEGGTAWHAALRATPQDRQAIQQRFEDIVRFQSRGDPGLSAQADARFHLAIAEAAHNAVLLQMMRGVFELLRSTVTENRHRMYLIQHTQEQLTAQHQALMEAILRGDAEAARATVWQHLEFVHGSVRKLDEDEARRARSSRLPPFKY
ncbi:transcriptional regulator LldR [Castellaniella daejeonensis]|jgi:GntR family L-lactate dehydrogenase operon transcriptional regulator|uniref:Transcriptional regulator LldR n=1 Tax=Castellaniella daejeonensis TaxID=659013 RepID=A0ABN0TKM6_9BURK|nr:transcriptional regulator LldR [Castellaniella sp.]HET8702318.1 transcriptional regulator LldR [Castellaniella sp.]